MHAEWRSRTLRMDWRRNLLNTSSQGMSACFCISSRTSDRILSFVCRWENSRSMCLLRSTRSISWAIWTRFEPAFASLAIVVVPISRSILIFDSLTDRFFRRVLCLLFYQPILQILLVHLRLLSVQKKHILVGALIYGHLFALSFDIAGELSILSCEKPFFVTSMGLRIIAHW